MYNQTKKKGLSAAFRIRSQSWRLYNQTKKKALTVAYRIKSTSWRVVNQSRKRARPIVRKAVNKLPGGHRIAAPKRAALNMAMSAGERRLPNRVNPQVPESARQILVFGDMGLGNFLMFTPALTTLRKRYPDAEIVVIFFKARGAEIVAEGNPDIDRIVTIDMPKRAGIRPFRHLIAKAREARINPDMIVARWNGSPYVSMLTMWLRPATRVGHVSSAGFVGYYDDVFNFPVSMTEEAHEVERNLDLVRALGAEPATYSMHLPVGEEHHAEAEQLIAERGFDAKRLICLQTGSSQLQAWKRWPEASWAALAEKLTLAGYDIAFVGSRDEAGIADSIIAATPSLVGQDRRNICGALSVNGTGALLSRSQCIICNDSGLMHVAASVGTPIIGLFGPTEYDRTRPFVDNCVILRHPCHCNHDTLFSRATLAKIEACERPCLVNTTPDDVMRELSALVALPDSAKKTKRPRKAAKAKAAG